MLSTAVAVTTLLFSLRHKAGRSDAGKCGCLVIVRGVTRDANGTNQLTFGGADQDTAWIRHHITAEHAVDCLHEIGLLFGTGH